MLETCTLADVKRIKAQKPHIYLAAARAHDERNGTITRYFNGKYLVGDANTLETIFSTIDGDKLLERVRK